jgi:hypothetical protein
VGAHPSRSARPASRQRQPHAAPAGRDLCPLAIWRRRCRPGALTGRRVRGTKGDAGSGDPAYSLPVATKDAPAMRPFPRKQDATELAKRLLTGCNPNSCGSATVPVAPVGVPPTESLRFLPPSAVLLRRTGPPSPRSAGLRRTGAALLRRTGRLLLWTFSARSAFRIWAVPNRPRGRAPPSRRFPAPFLGLRVSAPGSGRAQRPPPRLGCRTPQSAIVRF